MFYEGQRVVRLPDARNGKWKWGDEEAIIHKVAGGRIYFKDKKFYNNIGWKANRFHSILEKDLDHRCKYI